jgi:hypothetical protein
MLYALNEVNMEWSLFIEIIAVPIVGYLMYKISNLQKELEDHKLNVAEHYMTKEDSEKAENKIYNILNKMNDKLDRLIQKANE